MHDWKLQLAGHGIRTSMNSQSVCIRKWYCCCQHCCSFFTFICFQWFHISLLNFIGVCISQTFSHQKYLNIIPLYISAISKIPRSKVYSGYLTAETKYSCRFVCCTVNKISFISKISFKQHYCWIKVNWDGNQKVPNKQAYFAVVLKWSFLSANTVLNCSASPSREQTLVLCYPSN